MGKDFEENDEVRPDGEGSEAHASDPESQEGLTVDDILGAEQTAEAAGADEVAADPASAELLNDLKRVTAEYANYRHRTEANRKLEADRTTGSVVKKLLPVLDDLDRAEKHGDLEPGSAFATIAEKIRGSLSGLGIVSYGVAGELFDPTQHEAIVEIPTPGATEQAILEVVETGYRLGDVELRPAKVVVAKPVD